MSPADSVSAAPPVVLILAFEKGLSLAPLTHRCPKALLPFGGPFRLIDVALSNALHSGIERAYVVTDHGAGQVADYVEASWGRLGKKVFAVAVPALPDGHYRGTADAVVESLKLAAGSDAREVLVLSADQVGLMDYRGMIHFHRARRADATIAVAPPSRSFASVRSLVRFDAESRVLAFSDDVVETSGLPVDTGVYVFDIDALRANYRVEDWDLAAQVLPRLAGRGRVFACRFDREARGQSSYWMDAGTIDGYFHAHEAVLDGRFALDSKAWPLRNSLGREVRKFEHLEPGSSILDPSAVVEATDVRGAVIGPGAFVGANAYLRNVVVLPGANIGRGASIRSAIVGEGARVRAGASIGWRVGSRSPYLVTAGGVTVVAGDAAEASSRRPGADAKLVLVADGDADYLGWARQVLESQGCRVITARSADRFMELVVRHRAELKVVTCGTGLEMSTARLIRFARNNLVAAWVAARPHAVLNGRSKPERLISTVTDFLAAAPPGRPIRPTDDSKFDARSQSRKG